MPKLVNRAKMTTATTGTGTLTLGSAVDGYQTFANAGVANGNIVRYAIEDGNAWEIGLGTYSSTGTTLTRGTIESSTGTAINLSGNATVFVTAAAGDLQELVTFAETFALPTVDGTNGQVLTTNGSGTLSFTSISGYTNADVDAHLNTSTAASGEVLSWNGSDYDWVTAGGAFSVVGTNNLKAIATLPNLTTGANNFVAGNNAALALTTGSNNFVVGDAAFINGSTGGRNVVIGQQAIGTGAASAGAGDNVAIGYRACRNLSTATSVIAIGLNAARDLTTGSNNVALGNGALDAATTGGRNIAIGQDAMGLGVATATNGQNVAIGYQAGYDLTSGVQNVLSGVSAGANLTTGRDNVALGTFVMNNATTGGYNVAIGVQALGFGVVSASNGYNIAIGDQSGYQITSGIGNITLGVQAGHDLTTGSNNVIVGSEAGDLNTTGSTNVYVGYRAGDATTAANNQIIIGAEADASSATVSNEITLGNTSITRFRIPGIQAAASDGDVLTYDATNGILSLQAAGGGGGLTLLSETTISSAVTSIDITFPAGYKMYKMIWRKLRLAADDQTINMTQLDSGGSPLDFPSTHNNLTWGRAGSTTYSDSLENASIWRITPSSMPADTTAQPFDGVDFDFTIWGVRETDQHMAGIGLGSYFANSSRAAVHTGFSSSLLTQNSGVRISNSAGQNFTSGSILLYGVA